jgi:hypothetical protein
LKAVDTRSVLEGQLKELPEPGKRTESITFRLASHILYMLRSEAKQKDISVNTLASQILKEHIQWHAHAAKAGFISVRRGLIVQLLEKYTEEELHFMVEDATRKEVKSFIMLLRNEYNIESALDVLETWIKISGYHYRHELIDTKHSYVIQHNMGTKWSLCLHKIYQSIFQEFGLGKPHFDINDSSLSFIVDTETLVQ